MITYWLNRNHPHFHPSLFLSAPTPTGRADRAARERLEWRVSPSNPFSSFRHPNLLRESQYPKFWASTVLVLLLIIIGLQIPTHLAHVLIPFLIAWGLAAWSCIQLDFLFFLIQRGHDFRWAWWQTLATRLVGFATAVAGSAILMAVGTSFSEIFIAHIVGYWLLLVTIRQVDDRICARVGEEGDNRYGPPPEPLPHPDEIDPIDF